MSLLELQFLLLLFYFLVVVITVIERSYFYFFHCDLLIFGRGSSPSQLIRQGRLSGLRDQVYGRTDLLSRGVMMLLDAQHNSHSQRSGCLLSWLAEQRQWLLLQLNKITKIAVICALLGGLAAVYWFAHVGSALAPQTDAVAQSLRLASFGLLTAAFLRVLFYVFRNWANRLMTSLEEVLDEMNAELPVSNKNFTYFQDIDLGYSSAVTSAWEVSH